ncbi:FAD-dependent monooxygenase [Tropicimonas isoalkanivorans]|uniref:2-octaprenyl-6-methoxyphenol hydroxylase n=1 Tax=Tropicimonas isoalkanivorans TaxID=441112 RepID=A0A1I1NML9_9RHOB|nr:FAD-dependent monooxygenase [Tropicimonas isoalkanivorans]SFC98777.1 2-octaprenyl-6-methoxyphenol hydroxylase [Tropicimonas isoalkanivorans]
MARTETEILIAGGGIAGLTAALAFGKAGFRTILVSPEPPVTRGEDDGSDLRSTAFLQPAKRLFEQIGLWDDLADTATPLNVLRVVDTVNWPPQIRDSREFMASDLGEASFGWNLMNWRVLQGLSRVLDGLETVELRFGTAFASMVARDTGAIVRLSDGDSVSAKLVIGADGRNSAVREASGIGVHTTRYGQKTLAFVVGHPKPHANVSTEIYNEGGPFTLVPLPDLDGQHASAVVWMNPGQRAEEMAALDRETFETRISERSSYILGPLSLKSERRLWPIISQRADHLSAPRVALMAEAAHVIPPIGAQGLNTSLNDLILLRDLALMAGRAGLGGDRMLAKYDRQRAADIRRRVAAIDVFNRVTRSGNPQVQMLRLAGMKAVHDVNGLRETIMRVGMGG